MANWAQLMFEVNVGWRYFGVALAVLFDSSKLTKWRYYLFFLISFVFGGCRWSDAFALINEGCACFFFSFFLHTLRKSWLRTEAEYRWPNTLRSANLWCWMWAGLRVVVVVVVVKTWCSGPAAAVRDFLGTLAGSSEDGFEAYPSAR